MILRPLNAPIALMLSLLLLCTHYAWAEDDSPFDCHVNVDGGKFDLTSLAGEQTTDQTRQMPPSSTTDLLRFNLCADLEKQKNVAERDQCTEGTRACLIQVNRKKDEPDRIIAVIPLMKSPTPDLVFKMGESPSKFISIISKGLEYPHPINTTPTNQSLNITILCSPQETLKPIFKSYDGSQVVVEWSAPAGCPLQGDDNGNGGEKGGEDDSKRPDDKTQHAGSGIGWFFLMLILAFAAYFGLGAYYNYSKYGARGADLIPHRDFWKDVPYMLNDVVRHLCSSVRPRRPSNRGYIAV